MVQDNLMGDRGTHQMHLALAGCPHDPIGVRAGKRQMDLGGLVARVVVSHTDVDGAIVVEGVKHQIISLRPQGPVIGDRDARLQQCTASSLHGSNGGHLPKSTRASRCVAEMYGSMWLSTTGKLARADEKDSCAHNVGGSVLINLTMGDKRLKSE